MNIQSISGVNQTMNSMRTDFQNFSTAANNLQSALNSGNQDQITLSESGLSQALGLLMGDMTNAQGQSSGTNGATSPIQQFQNDLQSLQSALTSVNGSQSSSSQDSTLSTALNNVLSDLSSMRSHHHHHHQSSGSGSSGNTQGQNPLQAFQSDLQALQSALSSTDSSQGTSSGSTLQWALTNVLNDISSLTQGWQTGADTGYTVNTLA